MKKVMEAAGGLLIAAAAVLLFLNVFAGSIGGGLKQGAKQPERESAHPQQEYEEAVLADPALSYTGDTAKKADEAFGIYDQIEVMDSHDGYQRNLKDAVLEGRIVVKELGVEQKTDSGMEAAQADIDMDAGTLCIKESGIYRIRIKGMDRHNNPAQTAFLIAVNRKGA